MKKFLLKSKKILYRAIPFVVALILFCYSGTGASAAYEILDYQDYIEDYTVDGEWVKVAFPKSLGWWFWYQTAKPTLLQTGQYDTVHGTWSRSVKLDFNSVDWSPFMSGSRPYSTRVVDRPLGYSVLDLRNIPDGTLCETEFGVFYENVKNLYSVSATLYFQYFDSEWQAISSQALHSFPFEIVETTDFVQSFSVNAVIIKPVGAVYCMPRTAVELETVSFPAGNGIMYVNFNPFALELHITELQRLEQATHQTNRLLAEIQKQNDNLINGTPEQNEKVDAAVGELDSAGDRLGNLTEDMKVDKPDLSDVDVSPDALVSPIDRATLTAPLVKLWENPTILGMITIVFVLILVSWVFFGKKD